MITSLTPEQKELLVEVKDEWLDRFFSLSFDEEKTRELINWIYEEFLEVEKPLIFVMDSPLACQLAANALKVGVSMNINVFDVIYSLFAEMDEEIHSKISNTPYKSVWVNSGLCDIIDQVREGVCGAVRGSVKKQIRDRVYDCVKNGVNCDVWREVFSSRHKIFIQLCKNIEVEVMHQLQSQFDGKSFENLKRRVASGIWRDVRNEIFEQRKERGIWGGLASGIESKLSEKGTRELRNILSSVEKEAKRSCENEAGYIFNSVRSQIYDDIDADATKKIDSKCSDEAGEKIFRELAFKIWLEIGCRIGRTVKKLFKNLSFEQLDGEIREKVEGEVRIEPVNQTSRAVSFTPFVDACFGIANDAVRKINREVVEKVDERVGKEVRERITSKLGEQVCIKSGSEIPEAEAEALKIYLEIRRITARVAENLRKQVDGKSIEIRNECSNRIFLNINKQLFLWVCSRLLDEVKARIKIFVQNPVESEARKQILEKSNAFDNFNGKIFHETHKEVFSDMDRQIRRSDVWNSVWNEVWNAVRLKIYGQIVGVSNRKAKEAVEGSSGKNPFDNVKWDIVNKAEREIKTLINRIVHKKLNRETFALPLREIERVILLQIWLLLDDVIDNALAEKLEKQKLEYFDSSFYLSALSYHWVAFYDYFARIGVVEHDKLEKYKELIKGNAFSVVALRGAVFVSKPPLYVKRNERHRMHCEDGYAIEFADGWGLYFLNGIGFSKEEFEKYVAGKPTGKEILGIPNQEKRAEVVKIHGYDKIMKDLKLKKISHIIVKYKGKRLKHELYSCKELPINLLKVIDNSTLKPYILGVPRDQTDTMSAIAWTFGLTREEYEDRDES